MNSCKKSEKKYCANPKKTVSQIHRQTDGQTNGQTEGANREQMDRAELIGPSGRATGSIK